MDWVHNFKKSWTLSTISIRSQHPCHATYRAGACLPFGKDKNRGPGTRLPKSWTGSTISASLNTWCPFLLLHISSSPLFFLHLISLLPVAAVTAVHPDCLHYYLKLSPSARSRRPVPSPHRLSKSRTISWCRQYYHTEIYTGIYHATHWKILVHLMFLPLLGNFETAGRYSWGSACLTWLYRELCRASTAIALKIAGPLILLQVWSFIEFSGGLYGLGLGWSLYTLGSN